MNHDKIISLKPKFVGTDMELRVSIRKIGLHSRILVTAIQFSSATVNHRSADYRMRKAVVNAAVTHGAVNADYTLINPGSVIYRNAFDTNGRQYPLRIKQATYAFSAVA